MSLAFIMAFIGVAIALLIGLTIYGSVSDSVSQLNQIEQTEPITKVEEEKDNFWIIIGVLPIALFFAMFAIFSSLGGIERSFGGFGGTNEEDPKETKPKNSVLKWFGLEFLWLIGLAKKEKGK